MLSLVPDEIMLGVAKYCSSDMLASLARTNRKFHAIFNQVLYENDSQYGSSSVYHAIVRCRDQPTALRTLQAAVGGGATLRLCQDLHDKGSLQGPITCLAVHSPISLAAKYGRQEIIEFLVDHGISTEGPVGLAYSPLFLAILCGNEKAAVTLASRGALLDKGPFGMNALQYSICRGLPTLSVYFANHTELDINQKCVNGKRCIDLALISPRKADMVWVVLNIGFDLHRHLWEICHSTEAWEQLPGLLGPSVPVSQFISRGECLQLIDLISNQKVRRGLKPLQYNAVRCLMAALSNIVARTAPITPQDVATHLQRVLRKVLSIECGNIHIAPLVIDRYGVKVDDSIVKDVLAQVTSKRFTQKRYQVLKDYPTLLKSVDFLLAYCHRPERNGDPAAVFFLENVPCEVVETVKNLNARGFPLTRYGLKKLASAMRSQ
ncbi:unnamed protein product [Clonostachys chloroleuca]|uniref:F-box domain-containing protein n=1 Tax=Clonostachys chloroleuca TaxID=1926264 RepID=A0AA35QFN9_9HYPO|nr:unnamed protein product [Clonostachys chloroleuca]